MKIYLGGSMVGGRAFADGLAEIDRVLRELGHVVLTPFVVDTELNARRFPGLTGKERARAIFREDLQLLQEAEAVIMEVSQPSHGVGVELGFLVGLAQVKGEIKPTLLLRHKSLIDERVSNLLLGNPNARLEHYDEENVEKLVTDFMQSADVEGGIKKERQK